MKTLKKSLCLILSVIMVVGVLAVSASAATYPDDNDIEYKETVEVLTLIGVISGGDNGFAPKATLTREQAAKIITYIVNQKSAESLAKTCAFTDVANGWWSAGYIAYCSAQGIISGYNGQFAPSGTLTGSQWAKMLLCALGYDAANEGYTGDNWEVNVVSKAEELELTKGISSFNYSDAITREEACQMAFNALNTKMVKYTNPGSSITISGGDTNVSINTGASAATNEGMTTLAVKYFKDLTSNDDTEDAFGRPTITYGYTGKDDIEVPQEAVKSYEGSVTYKTLYKDLKLSDSNDEISVSKDGGTEETVTVTKNGTQTIGSNGSTVEVYGDSKTGYTAFVIETHVGEVKKVTPAKGETKRSITIDGETKPYTTENFAEKDIVTYTKTVDGDIQSVSLAEKVSGVEVTRIIENDDGKTFTASGSTYDLSENIEGETNSNGDSVIAVNAVLDLYLDAQGNVILVKEQQSGDTTVNAVVLAYGSTQSNDAFNKNPQYYARVLYTDGTTAEIQVSKDYSTGESEIAENSIVTVEESNKEGVYNLSKHVTNTDNKVTVTSGTTSEIKRGSISFTVGGSTVYVNSKTVYLVHTRVGEPGKEKDVYTAYTGYKNVPTVKEGSTASVSAKNGYATIVFVSNATVDNGTATSNVLIATESKSGLVKDSTNSNGYFIYNAVVDGEITTIKVNANAEGQDTKVASSIETNDKGFVTKIVNANKTEYIGVSYSDEVVTIGSDKHPVAADVVVYTVDSDGNIAEMNVSSISEDNGNDKVIFSEKDGEVTAIYIFEEKD